MRGSPCFVSSCKISHFGINPVKGGRPPNDSRTRAGVVVRVGVFVPRGAGVFMLAVFVAWHVRRAAVGWLR